LLAFKFGILASASVPALILLAFKFGILASASVPESILDAAMDPENDPAVSSLSLGLYFNPASALSC